MVLEAIHQLEIAAYKMLETALKYGKVFIITNAAEGWVQFSASKFLPSLLEIFDKITIISARAQYEQHFP